jgi:hypothetical protein
MEDTKVTIKRTNKFVGSAGVFRVMLDGREVGQLRPGEELSAEATPGHQELYVTTDGRVRSETLELELPAGKNVRVVCSSPSNPVANLFRIIFQPGRTLELEPEPRSN